MFISILLSILGIAATVILGLWAIMLAIRKGYPGELTFLKHNSIGLFDAITRNMPDLNITYKDEPISDNLVLINGFIVNSGKQDITKEMTEENLSIVLPDGFRWIDKKIVSSSPKVKADIVAKNDTNLAFDIGLFREGKFIQFEALAKVPESDSASEHDRMSPEKILSDNLNFTHRIANTDKVKEMPFRDNFAVTKKRNKALFSIWGMVLIIILLVFVNFFFLNKPEINPLTELQYKYDIHKGKSIYVKIIPSEDGKLLVKQVDGNIRELLSPQEFFSKESLQINVVPRTVNLLGLCKINYQSLSNSTDKFMLFSLILLVGMALLGTYKIYSRTKRYKIITKSIKE